VARPLCTRGRATGRPGDCRPLRCDRRHKCRCRYSGRACVPTVDCGSCYIVPRRLPDHQGDQPWSGGGFECRCRGAGIRTEPVRPIPQGLNPRVERLRSAVQVSVSGRVARVTVEEWFRNNGPALEEGMYHFPLPGEAVFSSYSLWQGDQELRGEAMDATQARSIYEAIVRQKRDPALIELAGQGLIRAR